MCSKIQGKPYSAPAPPGLPEFRVERSFPFTNTGVDFADPLYGNNMCLEENLRRIKPT